MNIYKQVLTIANMISIIALVYLFIVSYGTECFDIKDWYVSLTPVFISTLAQFLSLFIVGEDI